MRHISMTEYSIQELIVALSMFFFLAHAAWFDANGTEVPDAITVPYALLGISTSILHERYLTVLIATGILLFMLLPVRIPWLDKLNAKLVLQAYKTDEALNNEIEQQAKKTEDFFARREEQVSRWLGISYTVIPIMLFATLFMEENTPNNVAIFTICAACSIVAVEIAFTILSNREQNNQRTEDLSALGGADVIILLGMLGFYGFELFIYEIAITFSACLLYVLIRYCITKEKQVSIALLPAMFFMAPVRIGLALYDLPEKLISFIVECGI